MKRTLALPLLPLLPLLALAACSKPYVPSAWLATVPPAARDTLNPLPRSAANADSGRDAYALYCSSCHGDDGAGRRARPSLRNSRVRGETDGEIHWILVNGSKGHGMPAWRSLGDPALWQLVEYIRSMPPTPK